MQLRVLKRRGSTAAPDRASQRDARMAFADVRSNGRGRGHHRGVRSGELDRPSPCALGHEAIGVEVDGLVFGRDHGPGGQRSPSRGRARVDEVCGGGERSLRRGGRCGGVGGAPGRKKAGYSSGAIDSSTAVSPVRSSGNTFCLSPFASSGSGKEAAISARTSPSSGMNAATWKSPKTFRAAAAAATVIAAPPLR
jgi:hypothetical protein